MGVSRCASGLPWSVVSTPHSQPPALPSPRWAREGSLIWPRALRPRANMTVVGIPMQEALRASCTPDLKFGLGFCPLSCFPHLSGCAGERSRQRIRASDCLSAASSSSTPFSASTAGCPEAQRRGPGPSGRLFFGDFLLAKQKKVTCRRATPGQQPQARHLLQTRYKPPAHPARTDDS